MKTATKMTDLLSIMSNVEKALYTESLKIILPLTFFFSVAAILTFQSVYASNRLSLLLPSFEVAV